MTPRTLLRRPAPAPRPARLATALALVLGLLAVHLGALAHLATHQHVLVPGSSRLAHAAEGPRAPSSSPPRQAQTTDECVFVAVLAQASVAPIVTPVQPAALPVCATAPVLAPELAPCPTVELLLLAPSHSPPGAA